jgi:hypothetical protein
MQAVFKTLMTGIGNCIEMLPLVPVPHTSRYITPS